jgi:hypothetical protein
MAAFVLDWACLPYVHILGHVAASDVLYYKIVGFLTTRYLLHRADADLCYFSH